MKTVRQTGVWIVALICAFAAQAFGAIDLTISGASSNYFGAIFSLPQTEPQGKFVPVGIKDKGDRDDHNRGKGHNKWDFSGGFDEEWNWNRHTQGVQLQDLAVTTINEISYFTFKLDLDNLDNGRRGEISVDSLKIYTVSSDRHTTSHRNTPGTLRYDLDAHGNTFILLDSNNSNRCNIDEMLALIPTAAFADACPRDLIFIESRLNDGCNSWKAKFGEWEAEVACHPAIPEPSTVTLVGAGLLAALALLRRRSC